LGTGLGIGGGYLVSQYQTPVYQSTTKVMLIKPQESSVTADVSLNDQDLIKTYIALLTTQPVLDAVTQQLGFSVNANQIKAQLSSSSQLFDVTVQAGDPQQTAMIANTLVDVLISEIQSLQSGRFASSEESLQAQLNEVESQISQLEGDLGGTQTEDAQQQRQALEDEISALRLSTIQLQQEIQTLTRTGLPPAQQEELLAKQIELAQLQFMLAVERDTYNNLLNQDPETRNTETEAYIINLQEEVIILEQEIESLKTPAELSETQQALLVEKQAQLSQQEFALELAQQRYMDFFTSANLRPSSNSGLSSSDQQASLALYQQIYANLRSTYESVRLARLQGTPDLVQVEAAEVSVIPIQPRPIQNILQGGMIGLIIMSAIAYLIDYLDDTVKTVEDIHMAFDVPVLGVIADINSTNGEQGAIVIHHPRSPTAEAFRALRTNLEFAGVDQTLHTILVTSPSPEDGKSTIAVNLAASMVQGGKRILLLDADLRRPRVHRQLQLSNSLGLSDLFRQQMELDEVKQCCPEMENLSVITSSSIPPNPTELLNSVRMDEVLATAKEQADIVIIDSPPFIVSDPIVLAAKVDGIVLVLQPGQTSFTAVQEIMTQLQRANARLLGVVLNRVPLKKNFYNGHYNYYAPYYYSHTYYVNGEKSNSHSPKGRGPNLRQRLVQRFRSHPARKS
jgi:capsular exopolysaccharide synthesis family protein